MGRRYKRYGELVTADPPRKEVEEVSVRELSRDTSRVLGREDSLERKRLGPG